MEVHGRARFAEFELDLDAGELRRRGVPVPIPDQPLRVLEVLVEHAGVIVSREQLRDRLWAADTFVDFEHGLNAAVKRLRDVLGDSADRPRFVETVPKRGYRFVAPVDGLRRPDAEPAGLAADPVPRPAESGQPATLAPRGARSRWAVAVFAAVALAAAVVAFWLIPRTVPTSELPATLRRLTFDPGLQTDPAFSPDGKL